MTLIDDTYDCCGRGFDPMGDPTLYRKEGYDVWCGPCERGQRPVSTEAELVARLAERDEAVRDAKKAYAETLAELRAVCEHSVISEAPWESSLSGLFAPMEALRVCEVCGAEEEGPGFRVLKGRAYPASRNGEDCIYRFRRRGKRHLVGGR